MLAEKVSSLKIVEKPEGKRIMVFTEDLDDTVIGCGGTLIKHITAGYRVVMTYIIRSNDNQNNSIPEEVEGFSRRNEARTLQSLLHLSDLYFLNIPNSTDNPFQTTKRMISDLLAWENPDLIYIPYFGDTDPNHSYASITVKTPSYNTNTNVCAYEISDPLIPNIAVDISEQMSEKLSIIEGYKNQFAGIQYTDRAISMNTLRSHCIQASNIKYAEVFLQSNTEYCTLHISGNVLQM